MNILVLCTGNSCRSQIAEGYIRSFGDKEFKVYSAGIETHGVNPKAIKVMLEDGIDISGHTSDHIDTFSNVRFDYILTVCDNAKENCPFFPGNSVRLHHNFPDPAKATGSEEQILDEFRKVRDEIRSFSREFVNNIQSS